MEEKLSKTFATVNEEISTRFIVYVKCGTVKII
jgi:hypothetical protein